MLQFWWALVELLHRQHWTVIDFFLLVAPLMLFLAALIMPTKADRAEGPGFLQNGRWALLVLALFHVAAIVASQWFRKRTLVLISTLPVVALAATSLPVALTTRRLQGAMAVLTLS